MIVDDQDDIRESLGELLREAGYDVFLSPGGRPALDTLLGGFRPSCIVIDLMMPGMDGWQFSRELQDRDELRDLPVIVITAVGAHWGYPPRAVCVLPKPVDPPSFLECVANVVRDRG